MEECPRCKNPFSEVYETDWDGECSYCFMYPNEQDDTEAQITGVEFIPLNEVRIQGYFY